MSEGGRATNSCVDESLGYTGPIHAYSPTCGGRLLACCSDLNVQTARMLTQFDNGSY
jgi:hypothetical protein